jgi:hypothetical protein
MIPRPGFQGALFDSDNHGGEQDAPLTDIKVPGLSPARGPDDAYGRQGLHISQWTPADGASSRPWSI